jgi:TPR repeat protein
MNLARLALYLSTFLLVIPSCLAGQVERSSANNDDLRLSDRDAQVLKAAAADGDADAALKLAKYFDFYRDDHAQAITWYTIAAENGDQLAQCRLAKVLRSESEEFAKRRAGFWQKKCEGS